MKYLKKLRLIIFISLLGMLLSSCTVLLCTAAGFMFLFYQSATHTIYDITDDVTVENIAHKWFITKRDLFIYRFEQTGCPYIAGIDGKGTKTYLPYSIEEYLEHPNDWQDCDTNAKNGRGRQRTKASIKGIIPKGTLIYIHKITQWQDLYGGIREVYGTFQHHELGLIEIDVTYLLEWKLGVVAIHYPDKEVEQRMGTEDVFEEKIDVFEFAPPEYQELPPPKYKK